MQHVRMLCVTAARKNKRAAGSRAKETQRNETKEDEEEGRKEKKRNNAVTLARCLLFWGVSSSRMQKNAFTDDFSFWLFFGSLSLSLFLNLLLPPPFSPFLFGCWLLLRASVCGLHNPLFHTILLCSSSKMRIAFSCSSVVPPVSSLF
jgi:hypothetical protein